MLKKYIESIVSQLMDKKYIELVGFLTQRISNLEGELNLLKLSTSNDKLQIYKVMSSSIDELTKQMRELAEELQSNRLTQLELNSGTTANQTLTLESVKLLTTKLDLLTQEFKNNQNVVVTIPIKKLDDRVKMPTKAYEDDACFDVYALDDVWIPKTEQRQVDLKLSVEIPEGYFIQVNTRSSYGKNCLRCHIGIIDAGYRGELSVLIHNFGPDNYLIKAGDKVCQLAILPVPKVILKEVKNLSSSERDTKGYGSSGR